MLARSLSMPYIEVQDDCDDEWEAAELSGTCSHYGRRPLATLVIGRQLPHRAGHRPAATQRSAVSTRLRSPGGRRNRLCHTASMLIRPAEPDDALDVARVHVRSWQTGYHGLLPAAYLDQLRPEERAQRYDFATQDIRKPATLSRWTKTGYADLPPPRPRAIPNRRTRANCVPSMSTPINGDVARELR